MEKYINKLKHILDNDKKTQNLILALCLIALLLFASNYILKQDDKTLEVNSNNVTPENKISMEERLEKILSQINGVSEVSVMINYSNTDKIVPVYDIKENTDEEKSNGRTSVTSVTEKSVAYQDGANGKTPIVESTELAIAEGAIIVAIGANDNSGKIKEAVSCITGIPLYKISVFEK